MSETRALLAKISALRQRLDQAQLLASEARSALAGLVEPNPEPALEEAVALASRHDADLDRTVRPLFGPGPGGTPKALTAQARGVLERGRDLLAELRELGGKFDGSDDLGPLGYLYEDTVAMIDTTIRTVALMPEPPSAQLHLCRGLEVTLEEVQDRLGTLRSADERLRQRNDEVGCLSEILIDLQAGQPARVDELRRLAEMVLAEVDQGRPLEFLHDTPDYLPACAAAHGLTTARVMARLLKCDPEMRAHSLDAVVAALVHDVGMLSVPSDVLMAEGSLEGEGRRQVEAHAAAGARWVTPLFRDSPWLAEAVAGHHERLDGTGYPDGAKDANVKPLTRLLAVCDVYAAMCVPRPHRPARTTRTALADTLMLADQGLLDRRCGGYLLRLSFYPVGTAVELASGAAAVVVATPTSLEMTSPARPVVAVLTDAEGQPLPTPRHLDLAQTEAESIVRPLSVAERLEVLGRRLARWAA
jgi:hypothetical protein